MRFKTRWPPSIVFKWKGQNITGVQVNGKSFFGVLPLQYFCTFVKIILYGRLTQISFSAHHIVNLFVRTMHGDRFLTCGVRFYERALMKFNTFPFIVIHVLLDVFIEICRACNGRRFKTTEQFSNPSKVH